VLDCKIEVEKRLLKGRKERMLAGRQRYQVNVSTDRKESRTVDVARVLDE